MKCIEVDQNIGTVIGGVGVEVREGEGLERERR